MVQKTFFHVSVDPVIFSIKENKLQVLLINRKSDTYNDYLALPGGLLEENDKSMESGLQRILNNKTGMNVSYFEQLFTRSGHDSRGPTVSIAYMALVNKENINENAIWMNVEDVLKIKLAFDHNLVIEKALKRLTDKVNYSTLPMYFLDKKFTLPKLQEVYEIILNEKLDKSTFRKKIEETNVLIDTGEMIKSGAYRPSKLYMVNDNVHHFSKNMIQ